VTWSGLVSGTDGIITGTVYTIAISGTDVFVGGAFQNAGGTTGINYIARWDGNIWNAVGVLRHWAVAPNMRLHANGFASLRSARRR
jgi:hypothetical protein